MKQLFKSMTGAALIFFTMAGLLCGCHPSAQIPSSVPTQDITTLTWYMSVNSVAPDTDMVLEALNAYTRKTIGVEIDYKVSSDPVYRDMMPNLIHAGTYFDICFTSNWSTDYLQFADKGAFMDLSELLPIYAPETYDLIPKSFWDAVTVNGEIYGVPSYKEMGWQGGILYNKDMARAYGIDMNAIQTLDDYTSVLEQVSQQSQSEGKHVIGVSGLTNAWPMVAPYESLTGNFKLPAAAAVPEFENFSDMAGNAVFNPYASQEYMEYCQTVRSWNQAGYLGVDPVTYDSDIANRDLDFQTGTLFSYFIQYAPGTAEALSASAGQEVGFVPLMPPLFETRSALGGLLAISSACEHPDKALALINLLNTDEYVGTLIRHGIEGVHYVSVGDRQVDKTMGGTQTTPTYDYSYGWQFGTPFNQKWDISYPENIEQLFLDYNSSAIIASNNGFTFQPAAVESQLSALSNVIAQYTPSLETGSVDPSQYIPEFLEALNANGVEDLIQEVSSQLDMFHCTA